MEPNKNLDTGENGKNLLRLLTLASQKSSKAILYAASVLGLAAIFPQLALSPILSSLASGLGVEAMGQLLAEMAEKDISNEELLEKLLATLEQTNLNKALSKQEFFNAYEQLRIGQRKLGRQNQNLLRAITEMTPKLEDNVISEDSLEAAHLQIRINKALRERDLSQLNFYMGMVEAVITIFEPTENQSIYKDLQHKLENFRRKVRQDLGAAASCKALGDFSRMYALALEYTTNPRNIDCQSITRPSDRMSINPSIFFEYRIAFLDRLNSIASQRLDRSLGANQIDPKRALEILLQTRSMLTNPIIAEEDRLYIQNSLDRVNSAIDQHAQDFPS